jgi:putative SOS response-associated peptidase YedK
MAELSPESQTARRDLADRPGPVIRRLEDGSNEFTEFRWGFPPAQPKRPSVIN